MPSYRRAKVPGGTYFFTVKTEGNSPIFNHVDSVRLLGHVSREAKATWPFTIEGFVLLPDHWHAIWSLPRGDLRYSARIGWIKKEFTKRYIDSDGVEQFTSASRKRNRRRGVWQRRFWEHTIEDENDFDAHLDYIHWNPVKHGHVRCAADWPHSTFHRWAKKGVYPTTWGCNDRPAPKFDIDDAGE